jgi:outer membrane lipoprotein SlyB
MQSNVRKWLLAAALGILMLSPVAFAQQAPSAGAAPAAVVKPRVRGTIVQVEGSTLTVKATNGALLNVHLNNNAKVVAIVAASLTDIKPGSFVGTTAVPQPGGTLRATEVHIFPESMRGTGEGHRAWDLGPTSTMTNGTVALAVQKIEGHTLTIKYKDGEKTVVVTPDTAIVSYVLADRSELKANAKVFIGAAIQNADGSLETDRVNVGRDGLTPPM